MVTEKQMCRYAKNQNKTIIKKDDSNNRNNVSVEKNVFANRQEYLDDIAKKKGFKNYNDYRNHLAREKGFSNHTDYVNYLSQKRGFGSQHEEYVSKIGFKSQGEYRKHLFTKKTGKKFVDIAKRLNDWARDKGFKDYSEYLDVIAIGRGFTCYEEYAKVWKYYPGMINPLTENRSTKNFIGYIAECGMSKIFDNVMRMPHSNPGYDFICSKGQKIDVKGAILNQHNQFSFHIRHNHIADYFLLIGFNDILELEPLLILLIKSGEIIQELSVNDRHMLHIPNTDRYIEELKKYELSDKLEKLKNSCIDFNNKNTENVPTKAQIYESILNARLIKKHETGLRVIPENECTNYPGPINDIKIKNKFVPVTADESNR